MNESSSGTSGQQWPVAAECASAACSAVGAAGLALAWTMVLSFCGLEVVLMSVAEAQAALAAGFLARAIRKRHGLAARLVRSKGNVAKNVDLGGFAGPEDTAGEAVAHLDKPGCLLGHRGQCRQL